MNQRIEDTITPTTPAEVALLDRIGELKRKLWEGGRYHNTMDGFPPDPNQTPVSVRDFSPTLRLAGAAEASLDIPRGLRIEARTHGPTKVGVANYMSMEELQSLKFFEESRLMTQLHERVVRQAGKLVSNYFKEQQ